MKGLTWAEWIRPVIPAVKGGSITQVEKVMFICSVNHLLCQFDCTGRPVGILKHSLEGRIQQDRSHFPHTGTLLAHSKAKILPQQDYSSKNKCDGKTDMGKHFFSRAHLAFWFIFTITLLWLRKNIWLGCSLRNWY